MASTYTVNLGIEKIATGEQSGTWGTTTNTNFDIIDQAINGAVAVTLASAGTSGSPNTLAITDGSTSDGRNKFIDFNDGGDLGATAYIQLTPNDAEKIVHMRNSLSGGRSVIVFQGTYNASNDFEIPNGKDVLLKFDGAGASATVTDVNTDLYVTQLSFNNLKGTGATTVTNILDEDDMSSDSATALATQQSIKAYVDSQVGTVDTLAEILANGNTTGGTDIAVGTGDDITFADSSKAIFGAGSDLQIFHDGSNSFIQDSGTGDLIVRASNNLYLQSYSGAENYLTAVTNGAVTAYYDNAQKLETTATGIDVTGTVTADGLTVDGQGTFTTSDNSAQVTLISTDTDALVGPQLNLWRNSGTGTNGDLIGQITFTGEDSVGSTNTFATIYGVADQTDNGAEDGSIHFQTLINGVLADRLEINSAGNSVFTGTVTADGLTASNVSGTTLIQAVGVDSNGFADVEIKSTGTSGASRLYFSDTAGQSGSIKYSHSSDAMLFSTAGASRLNIASNGDISFYEDTGTTPKFFWDASAESLGIGTSSPNSTLEVAGNGRFTGTAPALTFFRTDSVSPSARIRMVGSDNADKWEIATNYLIGGAGLEFNYAGSNLAFMSTAGNLGLGDGAYIGTLSSTHSLSIQGGAGAPGGKITLYGGTGSNRIDFLIGASEAMRITSTGNVGIGESNPSDTLELSGGNIVNPNSTGSEITSATFGLGQNIHLEERQPNGAFSDRTDLAIVTNSGFGLGESEKVRLTASGNVGIGITSPADNLHLNGAANDSTGLTIGNNSSTRLRLYHDDAAGTSYLTTDGMQTEQSLRVGSGTFLAFDTNGTEAMRIDASGNLLVGQTAADSNSVGIGLLSNGTAYAVRDGGAAFIAHRKSSDGNIVELLKDNTTVGSIGAANGNTYYSFNSTKAITTDGASDIVPCTSGGVKQVGGYMSLGSSSYPFNDLYLSGDAIIGGSGASLRTTVGDNAITFNRDASSFIDNPVGSSSALEFRLNTGFTSALKLTTTEAVFNESGADADFRVESDSETHMLFVDASGNTVGILNSSPSYDLTVGPNGSLGAVSDNFKVPIAIDGGFSTTNARQHKMLGFIATSDGPEDVYDVQYTTSLEYVKNFFVGLYSANSYFNNSSLRIVQGAETRLRIDQDGPFVINDAAIDRDTIIKGSTSNNLLFVDAGSNAVTVNTGTPRAVFTIKSTGNGYPDGSIGLEEASTTSTVYLTNAGGSFFLSQDGTNDDFLMSSSATVFNETGVDRDFRVESDTNTHALFVDAGNDRVTIGGRFAVDESGGSGITNYRTYQMVNGQATAAASNTWLDVVDVGVTAALTAKVIAVETTDKVGTWVGSIAVAYGGESSTVQDEVYIGGTITDIDVRYNNTASTIQISVTYTGTAPTIYWTIDGMNFGEMSNLA